MTVHKNIRIWGTVQGVSFRYTTKEEAKRLRVHGFIRNEPDGSVYAEVEGPQKQVDEFIAWMHEGPRWAAVDNLEVRVNTVKGYRDFTVEYR